MLTGGVGGRLGLGFGALSLTELAAAITRQEGACSAPGVCRNNNPGNLRAYASGQPVDSRGIRIFPDFASGQAALIAQEQYNINRGLTLDEFFAGKPGVYPGYAPHGDGANDPGIYAAHVGGWLGIPTNVPLTSILTASPLPSVSPSPAPSPYSVIPYDTGEGGEIDYYPASDDSLSTSTLTLIAASAALAYALFV
jgi:hypothetical protein